MSNGNYLNRSGYWTGGVPDTFQKHTTQEREGLTFACNITIQALQEAGFHPEYLEKDGPSREIRDEILVTLKKLGLKETDQVFFEFRTASGIRVWVKTKCEEVYDEVDADTDRIADLMLNIEQQIQVYQGVLSRQEERRGKRRR